MGGSGAGAISSGNTSNSTFEETATNLAGDDPKSTFELA